MKKGLKRALILASIAAVAIEGLFIVRPLLSKGNDIQYVTKPIAYADISATVSETGIVNPVIQVTVGCEVSGTVRTLPVDFNTIVKRGQVLATLDPTTYQASVDSAQANISLATANIDNAKENAAKTKAELDLAALIAKRDELMAAKGLLDQDQMDIERTASISAREDFNSAQTQVRVCQAQLSVVKGLLKSAQFNLSKTVILSPFDGVVMDRNVSIGQTVAASLQTPTLFTLATNLTDMQVDTSVDEADVGGLLKDEAAQITVTAFPNVVFAGTDLQVRINPTIVQNVVTYDAVVQVHDTSGRLLPGMTSQLTIQVAQKTHVLSVPIAALLFRPLAAQGAGASAVGARTSWAAPVALPVAGAPGSKVTILRLVDGKPAPLHVVLGISDGKNIQITSDGVQDQDQVIVAQGRGAKASKLGA
jgi:HlyD family secretion protein